MIDEVSAESNDHTNPDCSVDTEQICRVNCAKRVRAEVNRTSSTFLLQEFPIQNSGRSENI